MKYDLTRPYLVIPKLILQPTWGGTYIAGAKGWSDQPGLDAKIGQSYELFSGSNLSLSTDTANPEFFGELIDNIAVAQQTRPEGTIALVDILQTDERGLLGDARVDAGCYDIGLLIKFTQALGNSYQVHMKTGLVDEVWQPKPESWYYFEPGVVTLGVVPGVDWQDYEASARSMERDMMALSERAQAAGGLDDAIRTEIGTLRREYDLPKFVQKLRVEAGQLVDLSGGGVHHSWEEDPSYAPLGNVLYELQLDSLDTVSTFRSYDKGNMMADGKVRPLQITEYFKHIDRSSAANDPQSHIVKPVEVSRGAGFVRQTLFTSDYYQLDQLALTPGGSCDLSLERLLHVFAKDTDIEVVTDGGRVVVRAGHSCLVPAAAQSCRVVALGGGEVLLGTNAEPA